MVDNKGPVDFDSFISEPDLCQRFGLKSSNFSKARKKGKLPYYQIASISQKLYRKDEIVEYLLANRIQIKPKDKEVRKK